ncbi:UNVERIFIED_CONTAM: putative Peroxidase 48 [Sesamum radiatum]|uniref:Peroxidase n=1 Tax=Sesamum radiatum TaxID=300843 RepID=A0AAW2KB23_SESRA
MRNFGMDFTRKLSFLVFTLCVLISLKNQNAETSRKASFQNPVERKLQEDDGLHEWLRYDYYNESCPLGERIIRSTVQELYGFRPDVAPALLRLVFHDCFVEEPFWVFDLFLSLSLEMECLSIFLMGRLLAHLVFHDCIVKVSVILIFFKIQNMICFFHLSFLGDGMLTDILNDQIVSTLVFSACILKAGGPFYPLYTGRRDGIVAYPIIATYELPSPLDDLSKTIESFASRGFDERETVSLLGAHSTGTIHCKFFFHRLYNFSGGDGPDPSIDPEFLQLLRSNCSSIHHSSGPASASPSLSPLPSTDGNNLSTVVSQDAGMKMDYEGPRTGFGTLYYRSLLQRKGLLFVDQQLTSGAETETWVRAYASDLSLFQRDFGLAMIKLSNLKVLTAPKGQVRLNCRKVN